MDRKIRIASAFLVSTALIGFILITKLPIFHSQDCCYKCTEHNATKENNTYCCTVDVARGVHKDYSAFLILDVTTYPFKVVAKFRSNEIKPLLFPHKAICSEGHFYQSCQDGSCKSSSSVPLPRLVSLC